MTSTCPICVPDDGNVVLQWTAEKLQREVEECQPCTSMGIMIGNELIGGLIYNNYMEYPTGSMIAISIATVSPRWATRRTLREIFSYPFVQLQVDRLQAITARTNHVTRKLLKRLGFQQEGVMRRYWDGHEDAFMFSMMPEEAARWI